MAKSLATRSFEPKLPVPLVQPSIAVVYLMNAKFWGNINRKMYDFSSIPYWGLVALARKRLLGWLPFWLVAVGIGKAILSRHRARVIDLACFRADLGIACQRHDCPSNKQR